MSLPSPVAVPTIETARLRLRAFRDDDLPAAAAFCANEEATQFIGGPRDLGDTWRWLAMLAGHWQLRGFGMFALADRSSDRWLGYAGPWFPAAWPGHEIGWGLVPEARGQGLATEAAMEARAWAYRMLGWTTAISCIAPDNHASARVAERLGARPEGEHELPFGRVRIWRHPPPQSLNLKPNPNPNT